MPPRVIAPSLPRHDRHVAPHGDDVRGDGSSERPWASLPFAARQARAGDTIRLAAGVYIADEVVHLPCGVNILGAGAATTIIHAAIDAYLIRLHSHENQDGNQRLSGFTIDGQCQRLRGGIWVENRNWVTLHSLVLRACRDGGTVVTAFHDRPWMTEPAVYVNGIVIDDCNYTDCATVEYAADGSVAQMKGDCQIGGIDGGLVTNVTITDRMGGYGIKFIDAGYLRHLTISHCTIRVEPSAPRWIACAAIELWNVGPGCDVHHIDCTTWLSFVNVDYPAEPGTVNLDLHHCRVIGQCPDNGQEAIEASMPGMRIHDNHFAHHGMGIAFWHSAQDIAITGNAFVNAGPVIATWGNNTPFYFDVSGQHAYRDIRIHGNRCEGFRVAAHFQVQDPTAALHDIEIRDNQFVGVSTAICEVRGHADRMSAIRWGDNHVPDGVPALIGDPAPADLVNQLAATEGERVCAAPAIG